MTCLLFPDDATSREEVSSAELSTLKCPEH